MPRFAWHRLVLDLPTGWSPLRLRGDAARGGAEFADLRRPRLVLQWETLRKPPKDLQGLLREAMRAEMGKLAVEEAKPVELPKASALVYEDIPPVKRDVAVAYFPATRRVLKLTCAREEASRGGSQTRPSVTVGEHEGAGGSETHPHRTQPLADDITSILRNTDMTSESDLAAWSVFDLQCLTPAGWTLDRSRMNVGDLRLTFNLPKPNILAPANWVSLRQVSVARLALERMPLKSWLRAALREQEKHYRSQGNTREVSVMLGESQVAAITATASRRRRFFFRRDLPQTCHAFVVHLEAEDKLLLLHGTDETALRTLAKSVALGEPQLIGGRA